MFEQDYIFHMVSSVVMFLGVAYLIYKHLSNKKSKTTASTILSLVLIYAFVKAGLFFADEAQRLNFIFNTDGYNVHGGITLDYLKERSGEDGNVCVQEDTPEFRKCRFIMKSSSGDGNFILYYIYNGEKTIVRSGHWPFAITEEFSFSPNTL